MGLVKLLMGESLLPGYGRHSYDALHYGRSIGSTYDDGSAYPVVA